MQQKRLILALAISTAILFLWSYLVPVKPPENTNQSTSVASPTAQPGPSQAQTTSSPTVPLIVATAPSTAAPQRTIRIKTPLYEVKLDTHGAEPVSWVITTTQDNPHPSKICSVAGTK